MRVSSIKNRFDKAENGLSEVGLPVECVDERMLDEWPREVRGLYAGVTPSVARAFLTSSTRFVAYEAALSALRGDL